MKKLYFGIAGVALLVILLFGFFGANASGYEVEIYKSASCGCCIGHSGYLEGKGFDVNVNIPQNLNLIKQENNIPYEMQSCHTSIVEGYFVEGHVPIEAINKLLEERPDIDGIALPGMPSGSPGMPGVKDKEWIIYALKDGEYSEFMRI